MNFTGHKGAGSRGSGTEYSGMREMIDMMKDKGLLQKPKLGTGQRFAQLETKLSKEKGINDPAALAASIGRKRYGAQKFAKLAAKGKPGY